MSCDAAMLRVAALNGLVGERRFSAAWIVPRDLGFRDCVRSLSVESLRIPLVPPWKSGALAPCQSLATRGFQPQGDLVNGLHLS